MTQLIDAEIVTVYTAVGSASMGGRNFTCGVFSDHHGASQGAKGKGEWGGDGSVKERKAMKVSYDDDTTQYFLLESDTALDLDGLKAKADEQLKEDTLSNLTDNQKRVLGL